MPTFNKYGKIDDPILHDGDRAFLRMNTRLRPNQLQPGEVALSENGRMETDGTWRPREGYDNITGALEQDGVALYALDAGSTGIIELFDDVTISAASASAGTVTITATAHGRSVDETIGISGLTGGTGEPNGNHVILTTADADTLTYFKTGTAGTYTISGDEDVEIVSLDTSTLVQVLGSSNFSDPSDGAKGWIVVATTNKAIAYDLTAADVQASATDIDYPGGITLSLDVDMIQAFDSVFLFREGSTSWQWDGEFDAVTAGSFEVDKTYTITTVGSTDFTAIGASANTVGIVFTATGVGTGTGTASSAFTLVPSGAKTQHVVYQASGNTVISSGVATVTETAHGLSVGDTIYLVEGDSLDVDSGAAIVVATAADANTFTFYTNASDVTASIVYSTKASRLGGGYINMPAAAWGVYSQRRMWMPYTHDSAASPATRNVLDEVITSDLLDPLTFDPIGSQFVVTAGISDYLVGVHPFNEDTLLAFNRNSIHLLKGTSGSLGDVETVEITREIGLVSRKSVVTYGNAVLFLSDSGIYSLQFVDEYNLRGAELPLSESIQSVIDRINEDAADDSVGIYHDNRYFLAVPLDGSTELNFVLVYSFLNGGWESVDFTSASDFNILNFHVGRAGELNDLYAVSTTGGLYQISGTDRDTDEVINNEVSNTVTELTIPARVQTRQYDMDSLDRKKWNRVEYQIRSNSTSASDGGISIYIEDPDGTVTLPTLASSLGGELPRDEDASIISRIGNNRGFAAQLTFSRLSEDPRFAVSECEEWQRSNQAQQYLKSWQLSQLDHLGRMATN